MCEERVTLKTRPPITSSVNIVYKYTAHCCGGAGPGLYALVTPVKY